VSSKALSLAVLAGLVLQVPFFPDHADQCGPSVLASVLTFWGTPVTPSELKQEIYIAHLKGSLSIDLLVAAQKHGFKAHLYSGSVEDLKSELEKGHPVIAFLNRGFNFLPVGHYVVINGYDDTRRGLIIHSGMKKNKFISYKSFSGYWDKTQRSTLLILPPEHDQESPHAGS
jgi:ABC-type bacteriocin/lantibiotic exporter with double-glycine peptidase domain